MFCCWAEGDRDQGAEEHILAVGRGGNQDQVLCIKCFIFTYTYLEKTPLKGKTKVLYYSRNTTWPFKAGKMGGASHVARVEGEIKYIDGYGKRAWKKKTIWKA